MSQQSEDSEAPPAESGRGTGGGFPRSVALLAAAVVALAIASILFSMGRDPDGGEALVSDNFSEVADHWNLDSYKGITTTIEDGAYRVMLSRADLGWLDSVTFDDATEYSEVLIESTVSFESVSDGANVGLACVSNPGDGENMTGLFGRYEARIDVDGHALVERFVNGDTVTVQEVESPVELDRTGDNELALDCRFEDETAFVTLSLNDEEVISVENEETPLAGYEGAGMVANSIGSGLEVAFDNLTANAIN